MTPEQFRALIPGDLVRNTSGALGVIVGHQVLSRHMAGQVKAKNAKVIQWITGSTQWSLATCPCSVPPLVKVEVPACEDCGGWVPPSFSVPQLCPKCHALPPGPVADTIPARKTVQKRCQCGVKFFTDPDDGYTLCPGCFAKRFEEWKGDSRTPGVGCD